VCRLKRDQARYDQLRAPTYDVLVQEEDCL
jgi:hypothetical protein